MQGKKYPGGGGVHTTDKTQVKGAIFQDNTSYSYGSELF
jgi:hypothetical protein